MGFTSRGPHLPRTARCHRERLFGFPRTRPGSQCFARHRL